MPYFSNFFQFYLYSSLTSINIVITLSISLAIYPSVKAIEAFKNGKNNHDMFYLRIPKPIYYC